jgi:arylformamidase
MPRGLIQMATARIKRQEIYRGMTRGELDRAYDNRAAVADSAACLARWAEMSWNLYQKVEVHRDLQYGSAPRQRIDFFPARSAGRPTVLFIHGGYWQWCDKEDEVFVAAGPLAHDINVAVVEYTLCPDIDIDGMVAQMHAAVDWLIPNLPAFDADPDMLIVAGSSAGAHLAAMLAWRPDVRGTLLISGLYELEPITLTRLNDAIRMDGDMAVRNSPVFHLPASAGPVCFAVGEDELPEMLRQTADYHTAWSGAGLPGWMTVLSGVNHFTIMDEMAAVDGRLTGEILRLCGGAWRDRAPKNSTV